MKTMEHSDSPPSIRINPTAAGVPEEHLLDEILWALYEREDKKEQEEVLDPKQSAMIYIML